ncbi:MAG: hypothetical protein HZB55_18465 [Deltaproteobacteria bacterium]|nr:hypothetical protein [Deltaproteobacteria bacterium]
MTPGRCARCGAELPPGPYGRRDTCAACGADLHACLQCDFYTPGAYNDCREPQADRVVDKERSNFCDLFRPATRAAVLGERSARDEARAKLDALFKKR